MTTNIATPLLNEQLLGEGVALLTMHRPKKMNALSIPLLEALVEAMVRFETAPNIRCVILTGMGKAFSAGADIADFVERGVDAYLDPRRLSAWAAIERFPKPLIAAVNGYALGGGCELALLCDLIIASENARFGQAEINIAGIPGDGGTQRLPRFVGPALATEMILTGRMIDADEARDAGLVLRVVAAADLIPTAQSLAETIASKAPLTVRAAKTALRMAFEEPLSKGLTRERQLLAGLFSTRDHREGTRAFLEKRRPVFSGS